MHKPFLTVADRRNLTIPRTQDEAGMRGGYWDEDREDVRGMQMLGVIMAAVVVALVAVVAWGML